MRILRLTIVMCSLLVLAGLGRFPQADAQLKSQLAVFQTTGIKICEVDASSAVIWTRLTRNPERMDDTHPMPLVRYRDPETGELGERNKKRPAVPPVVEFIDGSDIETIEGAVPGASGQVRVQYRQKGAAEWQFTRWADVDPYRDYTAQILLENLQPATAYELWVTSRTGVNGDFGQSINGGFRTAALEDESQRVVFTVTTGTAYVDHDLPDGYKMYGQMLKLDPDFFVHTGDIVYYDTYGKTQALARWHWSRMYSFPTNVNFHRQVASYFIKDDHDTWRNDCWPTWDNPFMGEFTFEQGLWIFREQVGMKKNTYRTVRWGKDLQVWMVEGRDFRSVNDAPDGPKKTIWGKEQKEWFKRTVRESDATYKVLISPTPVVGPDRVSKNDNHANEGFTHEGNELRTFIAAQKNMVVVCGDRHWQYVSVDAKTGVREYSCGPASDEHAGGWSNDKRYPVHQYLNVIGGFLAGTVERVNNQPVLTFRHYGVDGQVLNVDRFTGQ